MLKNGLSKDLRTKNKNWTNDSMTLSERDNQH